MPSSANWTLAGFDLILKKTKRHQEENPVQSVEEKRLGKE